MNIPCICPPKGDAMRHPDGDEITFREKLDFRAALTIRNSVNVLKAEDSQPSVGEFLAVLTEGYLLYGIESWTLVDEKGKPVPVSKDAIRSLLLEAHPTLAIAVGDAADEVFAEAVMLPLLPKASSSSPPTPISGSTSPTTGSSPRTRKPSKQSSITAIPTADTVTTSSSLDGDSSSSQSSTSAA